MPEKLNPHPTPYWLKDYPRDCEPEEKTCKECGNELVQCWNCGTWGCTCEEHGIEMIFADEEAIHSDVHFRADAMGKWYCLDYCSYIFEIPSEERE